MIDSLELGITYLSGGGWPGVGKCVGESVCSADGGVSRGAFRCRKIVGKKSNSVDDAVRSGLWDVYLVAPIVFGGAAGASSGDDMGCAGAAKSGGLKDKEFCAGGSEGRVIEFEGSIEMGFS